MDGYGVIITDITEQAIYNKTFSKPTNVNGGNLFQQRQCLHYTVFVTAYNRHGSSSAYVTDSDTPRPGGIYYLIVLY